MPGPPNQLYPHNVKREVNEQVSKSNHEWLCPHAQFESDCHHVSCVVETWVCMCSKTDVTA